MYAVNALRTSHVNVVLSYRAELRHTCIDMYVILWLEVTIDLL